MSIQVTTDDLLEALRTALTPEQSEDGFTGPELARRLGCGENKARKALRTLMDDGRLDVVDVRRTGLDGRAMCIKGYRLRSKPRRAA